MTTWINDYNTQKSIVNNYRPLQNMYYSAIWFCSTIWSISISDALLFEFSIALQIFQKKLVNARAVRDELKNDLTAVYWMLWNIWDSFSVRWKHTKSERESLTTIWRFHSRWMQMRPWGGRIRVEPLKISDKCIPSRLALRFSWETWSTWDARWGSNCFVKWRIRLEKTIGNFLNKTQSRYLLWD